ncbi:alpha-L-fucosidase [Pedobacter sp. PACM 27299]|uniref:alpha-L-fucosidase n=1 Tax=Pedobacter sp. PACM 27299 TaxID=1727164 RepID=UPI000705F93E|nr:alpha-L-fucosidase [Pedobacter sp. PACM 27299]ALL04862.1 alpha-L-fucosidase [Pedobacter sp. PACM 27299]
MNELKKSFIYLFLFFSTICTSFAQDIERWDKSSTGKENPNASWFQNAKFGMFIHWGLYSKLAGVWEGKDYYGSGEWLMNQAKIPAKAYEQVAKSFNPQKFNADEWADLAKDAGIKYMVITAKHHEGFAMYDSKVSDFNIVKASPYGKDPMKALANATRKRGIQFGFYYSQFLDWHEPNGGGNKWDFKEADKDYLKYYKDKSIPQLKELLTNYGDLGMVWFDMPGGLDKQQTQALVDEMHALQPKSLFSSRVGQGLGDYRTFGDSEVPATPIKGAWESIYTHNDSWGYISHDMNFKTPEEITQLLANVASKGGNLMLNIGPDGEGNIPYYSEKYLRETGKWLKKNGESIYGSTYGLVPAQPWGVTTSKPGKLFLHILNPPENGKIRVPGIHVKVTNIVQLGHKTTLKYEIKEQVLYVDLPSKTDPYHAVIEVAFNGQLNDGYLNNIPTVSASYPNNMLEVVHSKTSGAAKMQTLTYSHYFGDWKHTTCITDMIKPTDQTAFQFNITSPGDYKVLLEYACPEASAKQEGIMEFDHKTYKFQTLRTSEFNSSRPLLFIKHPVATITVLKPGIYALNLRPELNNTKELFKLKSVILQPIK